LGRDLRWYGTVSTWVDGVPRLQVVVARWIVGGVVDFAFLPVGFVYRGLSCAWIGGVFLVPRFGWVL